MARVRPAVGGWAGAWSLGAAGNMLRLEVGLLARDGLRVQPRGPILLPPHVTEVNTKYTVFIHVYCIFCVLVYAARGRVYTSFYDL